MQFWHHHELKNFTNSRMMEFLKVDFFGLYQNYGYELREKSFLKNALT